MRTITSITTGPRQSNFELLRIVAMFLVLVTHVDFVSIGLPTAEDITYTPVNATVRLFFESISIVCVNVFILISGWFGIKPSIKGLGNFLFQCVYFLTGTYVIFLLIGKEHISTTGIMSCIGLTNNWFIHSYLGLYILAPVINSFLEKTSKRMLVIFLLSFYLFQTYFGLLRTAKFIQEGYSTFSFIGLYCLGRYLRLYGKNLFKYGLLLYSICIFGNTALYIFQKKYFGIFTVYNYINPFVILGSIGLFLCFAKINIGQSRIINYISKSSFAVFLLHTTISVYPYFKGIAKQIYLSYSGMEYLIIVLAFLIGVFIVSVLCDLPRRWIWGYISQKIDFDKSSLLKGLS